MATNTQKSKDEKTCEQKENELAEYLLTQAQSNLSSGRLDWFGDNLADYANLTKGRFFREAAEAVKRLPEQWD